MSDGLSIGCTPGLVIQNRDKSVCFLQDTEQEHISCWYLEDQDGSKVIACLYFGIETACVQDSMYRIKGENFRSASLLISCSEMKYKYEIAGMVTIDGSRMCTFVIFRRKYLSSSIERSRTVDCKSFGIMLMLPNYGTIKKSQPCLSFFFTYLTLSQILFEPRKFNHEYSFRP